MRVVDGLFLALAIGGAAYVYNVKHEAEEAHDLRRGLERDIAVLSRDVSLLEADLAALEQPARLQNLVSTLPQSFDLEPISSRHYMRISDIPFRSQEPVVDGGVEDEDLVSVTNIEGISDVPTALDHLVEALVTSDNEAAAMQPVARLDTSETLQNTDSSTDDIGRLIGGAQ